MTRLTTEEIGAIFSNLEAVVSNFLLGHEKIGTITLHTSWLKHPTSLIEATGFVTCAFGYVTDPVDVEVRRRVRIMLGYMQRFLEDKDLVEELNRIKLKMVTGEKCSDSEMKTYQNFKKLVNQRMDIVEAKYTQVTTILCSSDHRDNNLPKKIASLFDIDYTLPKPSLLGITKMVLFGRSARYL